MASATATSDARESLELGLRGFNNWRSDAMGHFDAAISADPGLTMAHAAKGLFLCGGRNRAYAPVAADCLAAARANMSGATSNEQHYVDALAALVEGRNDRAINCFERILHHDPVDLFAHRVVQQELFWMGEVRWMREIADRAAPAWDETQVDYSTFLSVRAFAHEETGDLDSAEHLARDAVARNPRDCWGAHAVAHVLEMRGANEEGAQWLESLCDNWDGANQIAHHLWWHYCLFELDLGPGDRMLEVLDEKVRDQASPLVQAVPDLYIDLQNVASLLLRLELRDCPVGDRWQTIADACAGRIDNHASPFTSAHAAMALAAVGRFDDANALVESLRIFAADSSASLAPRVRVAALPAAEAAVAHRRGEYRRVVDLLMPARRELWRMGGSHAQRDIFFQILVDACRRLELADHLAILRDELRAIGFHRLNERSFYNTVFKV